MAFLAPDRFDAGDFVLRCYRPGDGTELWRAVQESRTHLRTFMPWSLNETTEQDEEERVRSWRGKWLLGEEFVLGAWRDGRLLASTGYMLRGRPVAEAYAEIGMWVRAAEAGRGLGQRVLRAIVDWSDRDWPWQRLEWRCDVRNTASARVAERCGFRLEGRLRGELIDHLAPPRRRDTLVFGLLRDDPRPWR